MTEILFPLRTTWAKMLQILSLMIDDGQDTPGSSKGEFLIAHFDAYI